MAVRRLTASKQDKARTQTHPTNNEATEKARELILRHGWNATAYQLLNPGIELWFPKRGDAVIGYVRRHGRRVVAGAPVCALDRLRQVIEEWETDANQSREKVCYFGAAGRVI